MNVLLMGLLIILVTITFSVVCMVGMYHIYNRVTKDKFWIEDERKIFDE